MTVNQANDPMRKNKQKTKKLKEKSPKSSFRGTIEKNTLYQY